MAPVTGTPAVRWSSIEVGEARLLGPDERLSPLRSREAAIEQRDAVAARKQVVHHEMAMIARAADD